MISDPTPTVTDHDFLPVAGHPDDNECTYRNDGTDLTYCARPEGAHQPPDHGAAGFCTDHALPPNERTETVARVLDPRAWDDSWFWDCDPPLHDDRIEAAQRAQIKRQDIARALAAAVVAALDDESARLRAEVFDMQEQRDDWAKVAGERAEQRDTARAALDRVRALDRYDPPPPPGTVSIEDLRAALDPEEPR